MYTFLNRSFTRCLLTCECCTGWLHAEPRPSLAICSSEPVRLAEALKYLWPHHQVYVAHVQERPSLLRATQYLMLALCCLADALRPALKLKSMCGAACAASQIYSPHDMRIVAAANAGTAPRRTSATGHVNHAQDCVTISRCASGGVNNPRPARLATGCGSVSMRTHACGACCMCSMRLHPAAMAAC